MTFTVADLLTILDLEHIEQNIFRGHSPKIGWQRIFGGLVIARTGPIEADLLNSAGLVIDHFSSPGFTA